ncbi:hypothetical protein [Streptomyces platensis]|uniref:hypothetical protein n=1 Tax=Streptomyces platensis TaxID=58346 RepID=UPI003869A679|nr:hypothetical protein OG962_19310 [Streptomyces platensis]
MQRAQKLRMTGLAGGVVLAIAVPLGAAMAGPADLAASGTAATSENRSTAKRDIRLDSGAKSDMRPAAARARTATASLAGPGLPPRSARTSRCGPQLTALQRIEAQTCVLAEDGLTWGRTYYRNRTGGPLRAALTLLRPDGTTVQVNCEVSAADPGLCETPTGATVRRGGPYRAVAEFSDAAGARLLLRSGSNSSVGGGGSGR